MQLANTKSELNFFFTNIHIFLIAFSFDKSQSIGTHLTFLSKGGLGVEGVFRYLCAKTWNKQCCNAEVDHTRFMLSLYLCKQFAINNAEVSFGTSVRRSCDIRRFRK